jgi:hypothetical protein
MKCSWCLAMPALLVLACATEDPAPDRTPVEAVDGAVDARAARGIEDERDAATDAREDARSTDATLGPYDAGGDSVATEGGLDPRHDADGAAGEAGTASCGSTAFCDDFEAHAAGALSSGWSARAPNCSGDGQATVDETMAHSGRRSVRVQSGGGVCNHVFATPALDLSKFGNSLWVRFYVRFGSALTDAHVTFLAMHDQVSQKNLRMGGQKNVLMWNREADDATLPELSPIGIGLSAMPSVGAWQCVEFRLAGADGTLDTYVDGARVEGLTIDSTPTHDVDGQWLRPGTWRANVTDLGLGWESYGNEAMTLWFDDVAVAAQRLGC